MGGPSIFVKRLKKGLSENDVSVTHDIDDRYDLLLVISTYDNFLNKKLVEKKRKGIKIVQRLDGIYTFATSKFLYPIHNFGMRYVLRNVADYIVYQSNYSKLMCDKYLGQPRCGWSVIYNGVDVQEFNSEGPRYRYDQKHVLISASVFRRREQIVPMLRAINYVYQDMKDVLLILAGSLTPKMAKIYNQYKDRPFIKHIGNIANNELPLYERGANVFIFSTPNPFCPNSVLEALACGLPIAAYDTGAMKELVGEDAGILVAHKGTNIWKFSDLNPQKLAEAAIEILCDNQLYKKAARERAIKLFSLEKVTKLYIQVFEKILSG